MNDRFVFDRAPLRVYWETTRSCDLACRHCRAEAQPEAAPDELDTAQGKALLDSLVSFGAPLPHIVFTGGDPLKRGDLWELLAYAKALGIAFSVAPSATPLLTPAQISRLAAAGTDAISLSLDGATAEHHDGIRGVPGTFERTLAAARQARAVSLPFQVNTLVALETLPDMAAIHDLVLEIGASRWSLFFLISVGRGQALSAIGADEAEQLMTWLTTLQGQGGLVITTTEAPHFRRVTMEQRKTAATTGHPAPGRPLHGLGIRDGNGILFIGHDGEMTPSGFFPLSVGNVKTDSMVDVYRESAVMRELRDPDGFHGRCGACAFRLPCGGSRARAWAATGDPLGEDPLCAYDPSEGPRGAGPAA